MVKKIWFSLSDTHTCKECEIYYADIPAEEEKRTWLPVQHTGSTTFHATHQRISGKLVFLLLGLVRTEVTYIKGDLDPCPPPKTADL